MLRSAEPSAPKVTALTSNMDALQTLPFDLEAHVDGAREEAQCKESAAAAIGDKELARRFASMHGVNGPTLVFGASPVRGHNSDEVAMYEHWRELRMACQDQSPVGEEKHQGSEKVPSKGAEDPLAAEAEVFRDAMEAYGAESQPEKQVQHASVSEPKEVLTHQVEGDVPQQVPGDAAGGQTHKAEIKDAVAERCEMAAKPEEVEAEKGADAVGERSEVAAKPKEVEAEKGADAVGERSEVAAKPKEVEAEKGADAVGERSEVAAKPEEVEAEIGGGAVGERSEVAAKAKEVEAEKGTDAVGERCEMEPTQAPNESASAAKGPTTDCEILSVHGIHEAAAESVIALLDGFKADGLSLDQALAILRNPTMDPYKDDEPVPLTRRIDQFANKKRQANGQQLEEVLGEGGGKQKVRRSRRGRGRGRGVARGRGGAKAKAKARARAPKGSSDVVVVDDVPAKGKPRAAAKAKAKANAKAKAEKEKAKQEKAAAKAAAAKKRADAKAKAKQEKEDAAKAAAKAKARAAAKVKEEDPVPADEVLGEEGEEEEAREDDPELAVEAEPVKQDPEKPSRKRKVEGQSFARRTR